MTLTIFSAQLTLIYNMARRKSVTLLEIEGNVNNTMYLKYQDVKYPSSEIQERFFFQKKRKEKKRYEF